MISKMGKDSEGSTLVYIYQFIHVLFMLFQFILVHLCFLSPSIALFIALLICFELFIAFTCLNNVIYSFIYIYYVLVNIYCDYPSPVCFSTAKPEWLWWIM